MILMGSPAFASGFDMVLLAFVIGLGMQLLAFVLGFGIFCLLGTWF